jgi:hypothetical protein
MREARIHTELFGGKSLNVTIPTREDIIGIGLVWEVPGTGT